MKFKGPENVTSISVGGECFNVGDDGLIETPDNGNYASLLAPHGFEVHVEAKAVSDETGGEGEKVANTETAKPAAKKVAAKAVSDETKAPE